MRFNLFHITTVMLLTVGISIAQAANDDSQWLQIEQKFQAASVSISDAKVIVKQARRRDVAPQQVSSWAERLTQMKQGDLPVNSAIDRLQQGLSKGIPAVRINSALDNLIRNLAWGQQLVSTRVARTEMRAQPELAAQAIENLEVAQRQGFSKKQLQHILGDAPLSLGQVTASTDMAIQWNALGAEPQAVVAILQQAMQAGMSVDELNSINQTMLQGLQQGRNFNELNTELQQSFTGMEFSSPGEMMEDFGNGETFVPDTGSNFDSGPGVGNDFDSGGPGGGGFGGP